MRRDLRGPLEPGETEEMRRAAVNDGQPTAFALFAVACLVVIGAVAGGLVGMWWALRSVGAP